MQKLSIIIVTWNNEEVLKNCLESLNQVYGDCYLEVIVVDNGNSPKAKSLSSSYPWVKYIAAERNLGFAGGNNLGFKAATRDYILLLNDDTIVHEDSFTPLIEFLKSHPKVGIVQGTMNIPGLNNGLDDCGTEMTIFGVQRHLNWGKPTLTTKLVPRKVFAVKGAMLMFKREVIKDVGGFLFYDHFKSYYEETDFCHRAGNANWESWFVPTPPIDHLCGTTSGKFRREEIWTQYIANILFSFRRNFGFWRRLVTIPIFSLLAALRYPRYFLNALRLNRMRNKINE